nr:MAG TPA: hypothetical protein [Caudoviricetes sp.]DAQ85208.1 MAG TPA: hypothetical protein [Caudoviricetes sp.]
MNVVFFMFITKFLSQPVVSFRRADFFMQNSILTCHSLQVT